MKRFLFISLCLINAGCATVGDIVIPKHQKSGFIDPDKTCLYLESHAPESLIGIVAAAGVSAIVGYFVDRTADSLKKEADRYNASYSARSNDYLFAETNTGIKTKFDKVRLVRYFGENIKGFSCLNLKKKLTHTDKALELELKLKTKNGIVYELTPTKLVINKSKAKVKNPNWMPWSWWMYLDKSRGKLSYTVRIKITVAAKEKDKYNIVDVIAADIPLGKLSLEDTEPKIDIVSSGFFTMPSLRETCLDATLNEKKDSCNLMPVTVDVSIIETDKFGDVIAKVSEKASKEKDNIVNIVIEKLNLKNTNANSNK